MILAPSLPEDSPQVRSCSKRSSFILSLLLQERYYVAVNHWQGPSEPLGMAESFQLEVCVYSNTGLCSEIYLKADNLGSWSCQPLCGAPAAGYGKSELRGSHHSSWTPWPCAGNSPSLLRASCPINTQRTINIQREH